MGVFGGMEWEKIRKSKMAINRKITLPFAEKWQ
jgi:hypothetical protein